MKTKEKNPKDYCHKCGKKLKSVKTDIMLRVESQPIDEPYDGGYKPLVIKFCSCWQDK
jgi:hypothetical protein